MEHKFLKCALRALLRKQVHRTYFGNLSVTKGHILERHRLSVAKKPEAEVAPLPLLAFVML